MNLNLLTFILRVTLILLTLKSLAYADTFGNPMKFCSGDSYFNKTVFVRMDETITNVSANDTIFTGEGAFISTKGTFAIGYPKGMGFNDRLKPLVTVNEAKDGFIINSENRKEILESIEARGNNNPFLRITYQSATEIDTLKQWLRSLEVTIPDDLSYSDYEALLTVSCLAAKYYDNNNANINSQYYMYASLDVKFSADETTVFYNNEFNQKKVYQTQFDRLAMEEIGMMPQIASEEGQTQFLAEVNSAVAEIKEQIFTQHSYGQRSFKGKAKIVMDEVLEVMAAQGFGANPELAHSFWNAGFTFPGNDFSPQWD